jgi:HlyD family secretion protein
MKTRAWILVVFVALALTAWTGFRIWQGPAVAAYEVTPTNLVQTVVATGRVISTSRSQIGSEITGIVLERHVREGDTVKAGEALITLRSDELAARTREARAALQNLQQARRPQAIAALTQAESQLAQAQREAQRRRDLYRTDSISREILEKAEQAEAIALSNAEQARLLAKALSPGAPEEGILTERLLAADATLAKTVIRAQFPGVVLTRNVEPGDVVQPGRALLEIARTGKTEVLVPVDERNLGVLALGQPALCIPDAYVDRQFKALVDHIAPSVDPQRGTVDVRLAIPTPPDYLREDMTVTATITTGMRTAALAIPNDAIRSGPSNSARVLVVRLGRAVEREIELGLRGLTMTEVTQGLASGDWVVLTPGIKPGQRVKAIHVD